MKRKKNMSRNIRERLYTLLLPCLRMRSFCGGCGEEVIFEINSMENVIVYGHSYLYRNLGNRPHHKVVSQCSRSETAARKTTLRQFIYIYIYISLFLRPDKPQKQSSSFHPSVTFIVLGGWSTWTRTPFTCSLSELSPSLENQKPCFPDIL